MMWQYFRSINIINLILNNIQTVSIYIIIYDIQIVFEVGYYETNIYKKFKLHGR